MQDLLNKVQKDDEQFGSEETEEDIEEDDIIDDDEEEFEPINELEKKEVANAKIQEIPLKSNLPEVDTMPPVNIPFKEQKQIDIMDYIENTNISFRRGTAIIKILEGDIKKAIELLQKEI